MSAKVVPEEMDSGGAISFDNRRDFMGNKLVPGVNVDRVDVAAGMTLAARFGYDDWESQTVVEYALMRHRRGEEDGAQRTALGHGIDLTSWYAILAAALAGAS